MTNATDQLPPVCCNPESRGGDLLPLLVVVALLLAAPWCFRWWKQRKSRASRPGSGTGPG